MIRIKSVFAERDQGTERMSAYQVVQNFNSSFLKTCRQIHMLLTALSKAGTISGNFIKRPVPLSGQSGIESMNAINRDKKGLSPEQREQLLRVLQARFEKHMNRHKGVGWALAQAKLEASTEKLWSLHEMERTGGEPDIVGHDKKTGQYIFYDCSAESPKGRRSVCYDRQALEERKEFKPGDSATDMAAAIGIELLTEDQYRELQKLGEFDTKTSSWVKTPSSIRKLGGALFCDRRYDTVFVYHNGAPSYYAAQGFRGSLTV